MERAQRMVDEMGEVIARWREEDEYRLRCSLVRQDMYLAKLGCG